MYWHENLCNFLKKSSHGFDNTLKYYMFQFLFQLVCWLLLMLIYRNNSSCLCLPFLCCHNQGMWSDVSFSYKKILRHWLPYPLSLLHHDLWLVQVNCHWLSHHWLSYDWLLCHSILSTHSCENRKVVDLYGTLCAALPECQSQDLFRSISSLIHLHHHHQKVNICSLHFSKLKILATTTLVCDNTEHSSKALSWNFFWIDHSKQLTKTSKMILE